MAEHEHDRSPRPAHIIGLNGERLTLAKLPKQNVRWTPKRKAQVVAAVSGGLIGVEEACSTYNLSMEEFSEWARQIGSAGMDGLKVTHAQPRPPVEGRADPCRDSTSISLTTAVPPPPERRAQPRALTIFRSGKIRFDSGEELCRVRNISAGGMAVDLAAPRMVGEKVRVEINEGTPATGTIVWVQDNSAGIRFDQQVDVGEFLSRKPLAPGQISRTPRVNLNCAGRVVIGHYQYVARVRDISQGGVKLEIDEEQPLGTVVMVSIDGLRARRGVVGWTRGTMIGVAFDQIIAFEELAEWLANRARGTLPSYGDDLDHPPLRRRAPATLRAIG